MGPGRPAKPISPGAPAGPISPLLPCKGDKKNKGTDEVATVPAWSLQAGGSTSLPVSPNRPLGQDMDVPLSPGQRGFAGRGIAQLTHPWSWLSLDGPSSPCNVHGGHQRLVYNHKCEFFFAHVAGSDAAAELSAEGECSHASLRFAAGLRGAGSVFMPAAAPSTLSVLAALRNLNS